MAAQDQYHIAVKHALESAGWTITDDPLYLRYGQDALLMDLAASRVIAATRDEEKIVVEIKSFTTRSDVNEFHGALGQYLNYRMALKRFDDSRKLFLAVPEEAFKRFFTRELARDAIALYQIQMLVYSPEEEVILEWI